MKLANLFFICAILLFISCSQKSITVKKSDYAWKYYGDTNPYYQTPDLGLYESPNTREGQDSSRLVIVCSSGGGTRAASFTIGIMLELERILDPKVKNSNLLNEIDYFSTTSGGGWGASSYIAYLFQRNKYGEENRKRFPTFNSYEVYLANAADKKYDKKQLKYSIKDMFDKDAISPGDYMEQRINRGYLGALYRKLLQNDDTSMVRLSDVFTLKNNKGIKPRMPMIIPNTTDIDNFMLVPFTPDRLDFWGVSQYFRPDGTPVPNIKKPKDTLSVEAILDIPLTAGIKASGGVPGIIGTSFYYCNKNDTGYYLHLQDGGVIDNQGLYTAKTILEQEKNITDKRKRIVIIIDASPAGIKTAQPPNINITRGASFWQLLRKGITDGPYPLMREQFPEFEEAYNCTVIHLSTEALLDPSLGLKGSLPDAATYDIAACENKFYTTYDHLLEDTGYYPKNATMADRGMLYRYIETIVPSAVDAKGTNDRGKTIVKRPQDTKGSAKIMFLAGRAVVQLMRDTIVQNLTSE